LKEDDFVVFCDKLIAVECCLVMEFCADLLYIVSSLNQATRHLRCKNEFNHFHHIIATIRCISIVQIPFHLDLTAPQGRPNSAKKTARYISYLRQCDNNIRLTRQNALHVSRLRLHITKAPAYSRSFFHLTTTAIRCRRTYGNFTRDATNSLRQN